MIDDANKSDAIFITKIAEKMFARIANLDYYSMHRRAIHRYIYGICDYCDETNYFDFILL